MTSHLPIYGALSAGCIFFLLAKLVEGWSRRFMAFWFRRETYTPGYVVKGYKWLLVTGGVAMFLGAAKVFLQR